MRRTVARSACSGVFIIALCLAAFAQAEGMSAPVYRPLSSASGTVRVWCTEAMKTLVDRWRTGFTKYHPGTRIEVEPLGSDAAMAALYSGHADIALLGRDSTANEVKAFEWIFQRKPLQIEIMTGSLDVAGKSPALAVVVRRDNPLSSVTADQLKALFGVNPGGVKDGRSQQIRTWDQLGANGEWAGKDIALYTYDTESGTGQYFKHVVLDDSNKMNWEHLKEFNDTKSVSGDTHDASRKILAALSADRYGLAVTDLPPAAALPSNLKVLALAKSVGNTPVVMTRETLLSREYPLTRSVYASVDRAPDKSFEPKLKEFLRYVLSKEGQKAAAEDGYLTLPNKIISEQLQKLD